MKIEAAKLELIEWLTTMESEDMLAALLFYKKNHENHHHEGELTSDQLTKVYKGLEDVEAGRVMESKEVWKKYGR